MALYVDNAISWGQWRLQGGWRNHLVIAGCYAAAEIFFIALPYQMASYPRSRSDLLQAASVIIMVVQAIMLVMVGGILVSNALRRDMTNRVMESHRLMPMSPAQAITGYLAGATVQILALAVVNLIVGAVLCQIRQMPVPQWLWANALLLMFSAAVWAGLAMMSFVSRFILWGLIGLLFSILFSRGYIFVIVPAFLVFCSPMHRDSIFDYQTLDAVTVGTMVAVGAQLLVVVLCIRGAARKYADENAVGLTLGPALAAMGIWAGLSWVGIAEFQEMRPVLLEYAEIDWHTLVVGAVASSLLVALLPMAAVAWNRINQRENSDGDGQAPKKEWSFFTCVCICLLFVLTPLSARIDSRVYYPAMRWTYYVPQAVRHDPSRVPPQMQPPVPILVSGQSNPAMIVAACAIFLVQAFFLMLLLYPKLKRANLVMLLLIGVMWFGPLLADVFYYAYKNQTPQLNLFGVYSSLGAIAQALDKPVRGTWVGLAGQAALCGFFGLLVLRGRRRLGGGAV